ncbi:uncharacterized protein LOC131641947 [Vicia villosa]|uniref:uncharacterized protein LOC131641947 n=1 Tax=Vicia villosa TaxID=3911 RepID=UPI00273C1AF4|nr:uncharacterized protein LOC131641947 [Vicia villosa]
MCLKEHHKMKTNKSRLTPRTELYRGEQQCWIDRESYTFEGTQLQEETKPSVEYMHWYRSLPFMYASYKHFLTDMRSIPNSTNHPSGSQQQPQPQLFQQQHQPQLFQQQPQHQTFQQQHQPQPFQQQHQPFRQYHLNPNYSQQRTLALTLTHNTIPTPNTPYLTLKQIITTKPNTNRPIFVHPCNSHLSRIQTFIPLTSNKTLQPHTLNHPPLLTSQHHDPPHTQSTSNLNLDLNVSDYELINQIWSPPPPPTQETQDDPAPTEEEEEQYGRGHRV